MKLRFLAALAFSMLSMNSAFAATLNESVLSKFAGEWLISGVTRGKDTSSQAFVGWTIADTFLEMRIEDPTGKSPYTARVFFGADKAGALTVHWLDITGGGSSRTLGSGTVEGNAVVMSFAYPEGEMRNRLEYDPAQDKWRMLITYGPAEAPKVFSDWMFTRAKN